MRSEIWGVGYIHNSLLWNGLLFWLNWISRELNEINGIKEKDNKFSTITFCDILHTLTKPEFLFRLLRNHPGFQTLSEDTMFSLSPPNSIHARVDSKELISKIQSSQDIKTGIRLNPSGKFLNIKAKQSFLLSHALSFIQSEIPYSRVRDTYNPYRTKNGDGSFSECSQGRRSV